MKSIPCDLKQAKAYIRRTDYADLAINSNGKLGAQFVNIIKILQESLKSICKWNKARGALTSILRELEGLASSVPTGLGWTAFRFIRKLLKDGGVQKVIAGIAEKLVQLQESSEARSTLVKLNSTDFASYIFLFKASKILLDTLPPYLELDDDRKDTTALKVTLVKKGEKQALGNTIVEAKAKLGSLYDEIKMRRKPQLKPIKKQKKKVRRKQVEIEVNGVVESKKIQLGSQTKEFLEFLPFPQAQESSECMVVSPNHFLDSHVYENDGSVPYEIFFDKRSIESELKSMSWEKFNSVCYDVCNEIDLFLENYAEKNGLSNGEVGTKLFSANFYLHILDVIVQQLSREALRNRAMKLHREMKIADKNIESCRAEELVVKGGDYSVLFYYAVTSSIPCDEKTLAQNIRRLEIGNKNRRQDCREMAKIAKFFGSDSFRGVRDKLKQKVSELETFTYNL